MKKSADYLNASEPDSQLPDYSDPQVLKAMISSSFSETARSLKGVKHRNSKYYDLLDFDKPRLRRRIAAAFATVERLREEVLKLCPNIPGVFSLEEDWAKVNSTPITSPDIQENHMDLSTGAAIWILDRIRENGRIEEALRLLPSDEELLDSVLMPDLWDPCWSQKVIAGMLIVIRGRNRDCTTEQHQPARKHKSQKPEQTVSQRIFMDRYTAAGTNRQEAASRNAFESILALLPEGAAAHAAEQYEAKLWEWVSRYYRCRAIYAAREQKLSRSFNRFCARANQVATEQKKAIVRNRTAPAVLQTGLEPAAFTGSVTGFTGSLPFPREHAGGTGDLIHAVRTLGDEMMRLDNQLDNLSDEISDFVFDSVSNCAETKPHLEEHYGTEIAEILSGFEIGDPYELCFAALYLADRGSDLPWLYFASGNLLEYAGNSLPWTNVPFEENAPDADGEDAAPVPARRRGRKPELPNWYRLEYQNRNEDAVFRKRMNLAQIVYEHTGCLMPRNLQKYEFVLTDLLDYGITGKNALSLFQCITLMREARQQVTTDRESEPIYSDGETAQDAPPEPEAAAPDPTEPAESAEQLRETAMLLKQENSRLKHLAYSASKEAADERQRYEALEEQTRFERRELAELREILFYQQNEIEPPPDTSIEYPYTVQRRTVVFGGHDSWARAIKPMLRGDIRFIGRNMLPNADLIRHADMVWLQTNSLSHKFYNKIMDVVRNYGVPVHYFKFASAEKCAEQVALHDHES